MKNKINAKKSMLVLLPVFVLVLVGVIGAVRTNAEQTQAAEVLYGVVTDINGDAYTLALGEHTQSTAVASGRNKGGENAPQTSANEAAQEIGQMAQASFAQEAPQAQSAQSNAQTEAAPAQTQEEPLSDKDTTLVRTGVTTTLHLSDATHVVMRIGTAAVQTDVQRIAVGHVLKLSVGEDGSVQQVEILE